MFLLINYLKVNILKNESGNSKSFKGKDHNKLFN